MKQVYVEMYELIKTRIIVYKCTLRYTATIHEFRGPTAAVRNRPFEMYLPTPSRLRDFLLFDFNVQVLHT